METIETRNLPKGAKTKIDCIIDWVQRPQEVVSFRKMDGMYGQRFTNDGQMLNFNADFTKIDGNFYEITE